MADENNAADGDIFVAWALLRAGRRWREPEYLAASARLRGAVADRLAVEIGGRTVLLPGEEGFRGAGGVTTNPSYFVLPALQDFAEADGGGAPWRSLIASGLILARDGRFGSHNLPPDWLLVGVDGQIFPAPDKPPLFEFEAIRVPLYLVWGGEDALAASEKTFWRQALLAGKRPPAWVNLSSGQVAEFTISSGGAAIAALALNDTKVRTIAGATPDHAYYASALTLLADLADRETEERRP